MIKNKLIKLNKNQAKLLNKIIHSILMINFYKYLKIFINNNKILLMKNKNKQMI